MHVPSGAAEEMDRPSNVTVKFGATLVANRKLSKPR
jgi:hypothetical protein